MDRKVERGSRSDRSSSSKSHTLKNMQADPVVTRLYERMEELTQRLDEEQTLLDLIDLHAEASNIPGMHDVTDFVVLALDDLATPHIAAELRARAEHDPDPWLRSEYAEWLKMPGFRAVEAQGRLLDVTPDESQSDLKSAYGDQ
ncbi:hypothetical protein B9G55_17965 [Saccharibacillus sp. O16]|nr:hypothetical protein B9G55_17965 [Saccharibacillus sp. O16]